MPAQTRAMAQASNTEGRQPSAALQMNAVPSAKSVPRHIAKAGVSANPRLPGEKQEDIVPKLRLTTGLMTLPSEIRLSILKHALPRNENLVLDTLNYTLRGPSYNYAYKSTASILRVSKQLYIEAVPLVYERNVVTFIDARHPHTPALDQHFSELALSNIRKLEFCVEKAFAEIGFYWSDVCDFMSVIDVKLTFYHTKEFMGCLGELACRACFEGDFVLQLELHESKWAAKDGFVVTAAAIKYALNTGSLHTAIYSMATPQSLETITISASVGKDACQAFLYYVDSDGIDWRFNKDGDKDTPKCKYLVWEERE